MVILLAAVIIAYGFGVYWLSGKYFSAFKVDIKTLKLKIIRGAIATVVTVLSLFYHLILLVLLHLLFLCGLGELCKVVFRLCFKKHNGSKPYGFMRKVYKSGIVPILIVAILFTYGYFNMNTIHQTSYTVTSDKLSTDYRVVFISDTHFGTIHDAETLKETVNEINKLNPDLVILGGDIIEEGTDKAQMYKAFEILGNLNSAYGTYYVYGNHDRQRYTNEPEYSEWELTDTLGKNGIKLLCEDTVTIGNDLLLVGREDLGSKDDRLSADKLSEGIDDSRFILVADHQPNNVESNKKIGADLQLSGHTHGGQILPLGFLTFLYHGYVYGEYKTDDTTVIVSSGFAGWGFPIRTQGVSEYVVVELKAK